VVAVNKQQAVAQEHRGKDTKAAIIIVVLLRAVAVQEKPGQTVLLLLQATAAKVFSPQLTAQQLTVQVVVVVQTTTRQERKAVLVGTAVAETGIMVHQQQLPELQTLAEVAVAAVKVKPQETAALAS
jgi:hypothetical protein